MMFLNSTENSGTCSGGSIELDMFPSLWGLLTSTSEESSQNEWSFSVFYVYSAHPHSAIWVSRCDFNTTRGTTRDLLRLLWTQRLEHHRTQHSCLSAFLRSQRVRSSSSCLIGLWDMLEERSRRLFNAGQKLSSRGGRPSNSPRRVWSE